MVINPMEPQSYIPKIVIGIITYNNPVKEISRCLESIYSQLYPTENIQIIIRNQGKYRILEQIQLLIQEKQWHDIEVYQGENIGFGAGHNEIFSHIAPNSKAYLCMNPDGFMHPSALKELISMADYNEWHGIFEAIQEPIMHPKSFNSKTGVTDWCSGACLLIPVCIYKELKGFDEDFFLYCEDVDFSWRIKTKGYQCYTCSKALFFHYAMDRDDRKTEIWKSAVLLAHKWCASQFKHFAIKQLNDCVDLSDFIYDNYLKKYQTHNLSDVIKASPNFKNGLTFSEPMWR